MAMAEDRPEKITMRDLWADVYERWSIEQPSEGPRAHPRFLTMPGARAGDIRRLIDRGLVAVTENGAIAPDDLESIAAVEVDLTAYAALANQFPGMKIIRGSVDSALHSGSPTAWPPKKDRTLFRADIVNLDLNEPLKAEFQSSQLVFPLLRLVRKIAVLHTEPTHSNWTLCLTLHGEVLWDARARKAVCEFLAENCKREAAFKGAMTMLLGSDMADAIVEKRSDDLRLDDVVAQQTLLMVCVPKRILSDVHTQGWALSCRHNIRYGGIRQRAPMVSWIIDFTEDARGASEPDELYRECLATVLDNIEHIDVGGALQPLSSP
jgi:hypothetical protein